MNYNLSNVHHSFTDAKLKAYARYYPVIMETTHIMLEDMTIFGTIANLVQQGAVNIPIEKGIMTYDNEPVVCILAFVSKKYAYIEFYIITEYIGG